MPSDEEQLSEVDLGSLRPRRGPAPVAALDEVPLSSLRPAGAPGPPRVLGAVQVPNEQAQILTEEPPQRPGPPLLTNYRQVPGTQVYRPPAGNGPGVNLTPRPDRPVTNLPGVSELHDAIGVGPMDAPFAGADAIARGVDRMGRASSEQADLPRVPYGLGKIAPPFSTRTPEQTRTAAHAENEMEGGAAEALGGAAEVGSYLLPYGAIKAPWATAVGLAGFEAGGRGAEALADKMGASPERKELAKQAVALLGGGVAGAVAGHAAGELFGPGRRFGEGLDPKSLSDADLVQRFSEAKASGNRQATEILGQEGYRRQAERKAPGPPEPEPQAQPEPPVGPAAVQRRPVTSEVPLRDLHERINKRGSAKGPPPVVAPEAEQPEQAGPSPQEETQVGPPSVRGPVEAEEPLFSDSASRLDKAVAAPAAGARPEDGDRVEASAMPPGPPLLPTLPTAPTAPTLPAAPAPDEPSAGPQYARSGDGKIKMGADVQALGQILGSSLYSGQPEKIIPKELLQNAMDAVRGVTGGKVTLHLGGDYDKNYRPTHEYHITVTDNGTGMTKDQLATVFMDLGASGKRDQAGASGGFGLAKAAPLMMSKRLEVSTVVQEKTGKFEHSFTATPQELLGEGVEVTSRPVPASTPTGTMVRSVLDNTEGNLSRWAAADMGSRYGKSIHLPGELWVDNNGSSKNVSRGQALKPLAEHTIPGVATIKMHVGDGEAPIGENAIGLEINNHGIYQFDHTMYPPTGSKMKGVPSVIAVDVQSLAAEGSRDYPFTANREALRGPVLEAIEQIVTDKVITPAAEKGRDFIAEKYKNLPTFRGTGGGKSNPPVVFYDVGGRMTPEETAEILRDPYMVTLAKGFRDITNRVIAEINKADSPLRGLKGMGLGIERVGLVFSEDLHGVYIPNPAGGAATVLINPFSFRDGARPSQIAGNVWHTILHEIVHDKVKGHYEAFTMAEGEIAQAAADVAISSIMELRGLYGDTKTSARGGLAIRADYASALRIYQDSRGRPERERDPFGGEKQSIEPGGPAAVPAGNDGRLQPDRAGDVRVGDTRGGAVRRFLADESGTFNSAALAAAGREFKRQNLVPALLYSKTASKNIIKGLVNTLAPRVGVSRSGLDAIYDLRGDRSQAEYTLQAAADAFRKEITKLPVQPDPAKPGKSQIEFIDRLKTGQAQATRTLQNIADFLRQMDDALLPMINQWADVKRLDDHFRLMWKIKPGGGKASVTYPGAHAPLQGSRGYMKRMVYQTLSDGIAAGGVPVSYNAIDLFALHYSDVMKYVTARRLWDQYKSMGLVRFIRATKAGAKKRALLGPGFVKLHDQIAKVAYPAKDPKGAMVHAGEWVIEEGVGRLLNNYLSKDYLRDRDSGLGSLGRALLGVKMMSTSMELSLSGFHFTFETAEAAASSIGLGIRKIANLGLWGNPKATADGLKDIAKGLAVVPAARETWKTGKAAEELAKATAKASLGVDPRALQDFLASDMGKWLIKKYPDAINYVSDYFHGGGTIGIHQDFKLKAIRAMQQHIQSDDPLGAILRAVPALMEGMMVPLFEWYIPRLKLGLFLREMSQDVRERHDDLMARRTTLRELARQNVDFVEDRLGEMNFDNLFWDRTFKSAMQMLFRSVTWKLGTIRGGSTALYGQASQLAGVAKQLRLGSPQGGPPLTASQRGTQPRVTREFAWLAGIAVLTAVYGTVTQMMYTGKRPEEVKDLIYPQIDPHDPSQRVGITTYLKDYYHMKRDPLGYLKGGFAGEIERVLDVRDNKDFYGEKVYYEDDPAWRQTWDAMKHLFPMPFSVDSYQRMRADGQPLGKALLSGAGIIKAPRSVTDTPAEALAREFSWQHQPVGGRTREEQQKRVALGAVSRALREGRDAEPVIQNAINAGFLQRKDITPLVRTSKLTYLQREVQSREFSVNEIVRLWEAASPQERNGIEYFVRQRVLKAAPRAAEWAPQTREKVAKYFQIYTPGSRPGPPPVR